MTLPVIVTAACQKMAADRELVIGLNDGALDVSVTRASAVSTIPSSLEWTATRGTSGFSETVKYAPASGTVVGESSERKIHTGKYQTAEPSEYNWYVANHAITAPSSPGAVTLKVADNSTDVIAGVCKATSTTTPEIVLEHIFARTGTFTLNTQSYSPTAGEFEDTNYQLSDVSWQIQSKAGGTGGTAGTYNMGEKAWSGLDALPKQGIGTLDTASSTSCKSVHTSDLYCTPGVYTLTVKYTLSKLNDTGTVDYAEPLTKTVDVTLVAGAVNNITATAKSGNAREIVITVSLAAWGTNEITADLPDNVCVYARGVVTKASVRTEVSDFAMFGYVYTEEDGMGKANYMYCEKMTQTDNGFISEKIHTTVLKGNTVYLWAVDPYASGSITFPSPEYEGEPYLIYDNPRDVADQQDIFISEHCSDGFRVSDSVDMEFRHILHGIRFAFAEGGAFSGTIHNITVTNIKTHGVYGLRTGWRDQSVKEDRTLVLEKDVTPAFSGRELTTADQTFFFLPQTASGDCEIVFDVTRDGIRRLWRRTLSGSILRQGILQTFTLNFNK